MKNKRDEIQEEIVDSISSYPIGRLLLSPRIGKTSIVLSLIKRDKPNSILWVCPSLDLIEKVIPNEFIKFKASKFFKKVVFSTWKSLPKIEGYFDYIVLDEEQYLTINNIETLYNQKLKGRAIISMTGTPTKSYQKRRIIEEVLKLPILYNISINEAVDMNLLSNYRINIIDIFLDETRNIKIERINKSSFYTSEKSQYDYYNKKAEWAILTKEGDIKKKILFRMRKIYESKSKFQKAFEIFHSEYFKNHRKIIFCPTINMANIMCSNTYHSLTTNEHLLSFIKGDINSISMVNSGGIGFNYKEIDDLFIIQVDSDINGYTSQKICRALLKQPNHIVNIWLFRLKGTKDEEWIESALTNFKKENIYVYNK